MVEFVKEESLLDMKKRKVADSQKLRFVNKAFECTKTVQQNYVKAQ
jgi:hypothetical protein